MRTSHYILLLISFIAFTSCADIYYYPESKFIVKDHKRLGILAPEVSIYSFNEKDSLRYANKYGADKYDYLYIIEKYLHKRIRQKKLNIHLVPIKDFDWLGENDLYPDDTLDIQLICNQFDLDGVIESQFEIIRPVHPVVGFALAVSNLDVPSKDLHLFQRLYDKDEGLIYAFEYTESKSNTEFYKTDRMIKDLVNYSTKYMPYFKVLKWAENDSKKIDREFLLY